MPGRLAFRIPSPFAALLVAALCLAPSALAETSGPCAGGQPLPRINDVVIGPVDENTGLFTVTIDADHDSFMEIFWRGGRITPYWPGLPPPGPVVATLSASCMTQAEEMRIVASGGWYYECWESTTRTGPAIDPTPSITNVKIVDGQVRYDYEFPYGTAERDLRIEILPTANHGLIDLSPVYWCYCVYPSGSRSESIGDYDGTMRITATACNNPALREVVYVPLPASDADCDGDCEDHCPSCVGSPVKTSSGNANYADADPLPSVPFLPLKRTHTSRVRARNVFGWHWRSLFDTWLLTAPGAVTIMTEDAAYYAFDDRGGGVYVQRSPGAPIAPTTLSWDPATGLLTHRDVRANIERAFNTFGRPVRYRQISTGRFVEITYDAAGLPARLTDSWGNFAWEITTDPGNRLITSIGVEGRPDLTWNYAYNYYNFSGGGGGHLLSVTSPAGIWRTYTYRFRNDYYEYRGLESATDALGNRIEQHAYDNRERSIWSAGRDGDIHFIAYDQPGRTAAETAIDVTYRTGRVERHYHRHIAGSWRTVEISGGCPTCTGTGDMVLAHDSLGNVVRRQDARGYITETRYSADGKSRLGQVTAQRPANCDPASDANRCRQTPDTLANLALIPTAASVSTSFQYADPAWPHQPTLVQRPSVRQPGELLTESLTYDALTGETLTRSVTGFSEDPAVQQTRTTATALYDGAEGAAFNPGGSFETAWLTLPQPRGLRKLIDGPRIDASDVVELVYYPIDAAVPGPWRGRLAATRNALGHTTRWSDYDAFGNATRMVDPNGVVSERTFDGLGRLRTSTIKGVAGCDTAADPLCSTDVTTAQTYHGTGPMATTQSPNGAVATYEYDFRSRLRAISRGPAITDLRERMEYSYDENVGKQTRRDPSRMKAARGWRNTPNHPRSTRSDGLPQTSMPIRPEPHSSMTARAT